MYIYVYRVVLSPVIDRFSFYLIYLLTTIVNIYCILMYGSYCWNCSGAGPSGGGMYPGLASRGGNQGAPLDDVDNPYGNPNAARAPSADQYVGGGGAVARTSQPMGASGAVGGYGNPSNRGGGVSMYGYAQPQAMGYGGSYAVGQSSGGMSMYQQQGGGLPGMSATGSSPVAGTGKPNEGVASYAEAGGVSVAGYGASASAGYSNRSVPGSSQQQGRMDRSYRPY